MALISCLFLAYHFVPPQMVQKLSTPLNEVDGRGPATLVELSAPPSTLDWIKWCEKSLVDEKGIYLLLFSFFDTFNNCHH
jgi:hypothetical protein